MAKPQIRVGVPSDLKALAEVDRQCFPPGIAFDSIELVHYLTCPDGVTYVAEVGGAMAGFSIVAAEDPARTGTLITLDVLAAHRRSGLGSTLLRASEHWLRRRGVTTLWLQVDTGNLAALRFYDRSGFARIRTLKDYYGTGRDAYLMSRSLGRAASGE